jgi:hypothetical protein
MAAFIGPRLTAGERRRVNVRINTDPVIVAVADGLFEVAQRIGEEASGRAPDEPPLNVGLPNNWAAMEWALGKVVGVRTGLGGSAATKPRDFSARGKEAAALVGFGFPGRFNEVGTVHQPARPFLGPAALAIASGPALGEALASKFPKGNS